MGHSRALLNWTSDVLSEPEKRSPRALPPAASPAVRSDRKTPASSADQSPANKPINKLHRRAASYGGVPLPKTTLDTQHLRPEVVSSGDEGNSKKAPPSPFQPTVEEVPDEGSPDEENSGSFVEQYHMTPPGSSMEDESQVKASKAAQAAVESLKGKEPAISSTQSSNSTRPRKESSSRPARPNLPSKASYGDEGGFLSPNDAIRRTSGQSSPAGDSWPRPKEDFSLYSDTDDEGDDGKLGSQTPFNVESLSTQNTPKDAPIPSPRLRSESFARSPLQPDARQDFKTPGFSSMYLNQGNSPRPRYKDQQGSDVRYSGVYWQQSDSSSAYWGDRYTGSKTQRQDPSADALSARRPRANTTATPGHYAAWSDMPNRDSIQFSTTEFLGSALPPVGAYNTFASAADDFERQFHTTEKPKPVPTNKTVGTNDSKPSKATGSSKQGDSAHVKEIVVRLPLEDFFTGTTRKMKVTDKSSTQSFRILEVPVRPGLIPGSKVKFSNIELDSRDAVIGSLHFVIEQVRSVQLYSW